MKKALGRMFLKIGESMALGYDGSEQSRMRKDLGWGRQTSRDEDSLVGKDLTRERLRQKGDDLRRNNPTIAGTCERLALFTVGASGILPQAKTSDKGWNRAAEQWWSEYSLQCDSRGRSTLLDFENMSVSLRPTHGGVYFQKLQDGTIRPIECERIRQPQKPSDAANYVDGVRINPKTGQIIDFCVHSRDKDGGFSAPHPEAYIAAENILRVIKPAWRPDQVREIPDFAPILTAMQDIHEMNTYTLNSAKWQSSVLAFLKKQGGGGLNSFARGSTPSAGARQTFKMSWGEILEGLPGDDLEMKSSNTPNTTHIPYVKLQLALCASALNMPYEFFTLDLSGLDFSRQKGMLLLVNFACRPWKKWLVDRFLNPLWQWRIAMEMQPGGELAVAPNKGGKSEWSQVDWQMPEELWIDRQEAMQADVIEIQAGIGALSKACKRRGEDFEDMLRKKAADEKLIQQIALEEGVDPEKLSFMQIPGQVMDKDKPSMDAEDSEEDDKEDSKEIDKEEGKTDE